ncbi:MBL fold metallo-hydrolase [Thermaerobacter marianensis]|nr:MBL fold metallo-hydrolase [Thermaerobacter marianensis]
MPLERPVEENCWELAPGLYRILLPLPWDVPFVNAYLVRAPGGWILIDAGADTPASLRALGWALKAVGVPEGGLTAILLTHRHPDHAGDVIAVQQRWGGTVYVHPAERELDRADPGVLTAWLAFTGMPPEVMETLLRRAERMPLPPDAIPYPAMPAAAGVGRGGGRPDGDVPSASGVAPDCSPLDASPRETSAGDAPTGDAHGAGATVPGLSAGDETAERAERVPVTTFSVAGLPLEVVYTPGHSPGHVMLRVPETGWVFTGDHVLPRAGINVWANPVGLANPMGTYLDNLAAVRHLDRIWGMDAREARPGADEDRATRGLVLPGHGLPWSGPMMPQAAALVDWHRQAALALRNRLPDEPGPTVFEIVAARRPEDAREKPHRLRGAVAETLAFLLWMESEGLVGRQGEAPARWYRR